MKRITIAISGSSGFIGSHLVCQLKHLNFNIIPIDKKSGLDILDSEMLKTIGSFDCFIHLAALSFIPDSWQNPDNFLLSNYKATLNAIEITRINKAKFILFSSYLYGNPKSLPIDENHPLNPNNPYAYSKYLGEELCKCYNKLYDVNIIILRLFNIYGYGQNRNYLIPSIVNQLKNESIILQDSRPRRDFLFIDDLVDAVIKSIEYTKSNMEIFNLGYGKSYSIDNIISIIKDILKSDICVTYEKKIRRNEIIETVANITKAKKLLRWEPVFDLKKGLMKLLQDENIIHL